MYRFFFSEFFSIIFFGSTTLYCCFFLARNMAFMGLIIGCFFTVLLCIFIFISWRVLGAFRHLLTLALLELTSIVNTSLFVHCEL